MHVSIVGAGSVGLSLGTRLAAAGCEVCFVVRRREVAGLIEREGVFCTDPASGRTLHARAAALLSAPAAAERLQRGPVLIAARAADTAPIASELAAAAPGAIVVSAQNDVDNEATLAQHFQRVWGMVVRQTCTRTGPNEVNAEGRGRLVLGRYPSGADRELAALAASFERAGFDVGISQRIDEDLWLKLCVNLMSVPNALVRRPDHTTPEFVECKARLLEEARDVLSAAGIRATSCDARDRSLDDEIAHQRRALRAGTSARALPLYNAVWTSLHEGGDLEADRYHRRILALAAEHGLAAPCNARALELLERAHADRLGPESLAARDFLPESRD